jgi:hypothetical protein
VERLSAAPAPADVAVLPRQRDESQQVAEAS